RFALQVDAELQWQHLRAFLVGVERQGLPWRLRQLRLRAPTDGTASPDEAPFPKTLHVEQLEFARRQQQGSSDFVELPAGTAVLRGLQELARAGGLKDVVIGELTLTNRTPEAAGRLELVLWLQGKTAAAQVTRLTKEVEKAGTTTASPFARIETML